MQEKTTRIKNKVGITSVGVISTKPKVKNNRMVRLLMEDQKLQAKHLGIYY